ncbi:MAG: nitroreductase family protein [Solirubrobacterales bacterium]
MTLLETAKKRYTVRNYQSKPVEKEKLLTILEAGRVAPTAANNQPYRLIVVQQKDGLEKLGKAANIYGAPLAILVCGDHDRAWKRPYDGKTSVDVDASIVASHMMLQATELDLGSVWIMFFKPDVVRNEFKLPENLEPIAILALGYPNGAPASPERHREQRFPLSAIVAYEQL